MNKLLFFLIFMGLSAWSQPLKYSNEFVLGYQGDSNCLKKLTRFKRCQESKISLGLASGSSGDFQTTIIAKFSGDKGKGGGQIWYKINPYLWLGGESISNLKLELEHEVMVALDLSYSSYHFYPYMSIHPKSEHLGGIGIKGYIAETFSVGFHLHLDPQKIKEPHYSFMFGFKIDEKAVEKISNFFKREEE